MRGPVVPFVAALLAAVLAGRTPGAAAEDEEGPRSLSAAESALRSEDPGERRRAVSFLAGRRAASDRAAALVLLIPRLDDPEPALRRDVANALAGSGERAVGRCLAARLAIEADAEVLAALLVGLGALGGGGDVGRVLPFARDPRPAVRAAAITALGDLGGEEAREVVRRAVLEPGLPDPEWSLRGAAVLALARCGRPEDVGPVLVAVREGEGWRSWFLRSAVARLVAAQDPDPLPTLRTLVEDPDSRVAVTAAEGIGRRVPPEAARLLEDARPEVRAAGAAAVGRVPLPDLVPRLRTLARLDPSRVVRWTAARALFRLGDPEGDEYLLEAVGAEDPAIWAEAVALLVQRTGAEHGRDVEAWRAALARGRRKP